MDRDRVLYLQPPRKTGQLTGDDGVCGVCGIPHWTKCGILEQHAGWLRLRGQAPGTIYSRERALARMASALRPVPVTDATEEDLMAWRAALDVTPGAVQHYVAHARSFYRWLVSEGIREDNPAARLPTPRTGRRLPRPIAAADLMEALECAPPRIRPWLVLASHAGLRACEIAGLRAENVLLSAAPPVIVVAHDATKGHAAERAIPVSDFLLAELQAARLPSRGWVFRRLDGGLGPNAAWRVSQLCCRHLHACGIEASLHQLRHFFLSSAYQSTLDLRLTQFLAGHSDPRSTSGYAAFSDANAVKAVNAVPVPGRRLRAVR